MKGLDRGTISAVASAVSTTVITITALFALAQLRQRRRASQFDVTRKMIDEIKKPEFAKARTRVVAEFPARANDPEFQAEIASARAWEVDIEQPPEVIVLAYLEEVGIYVKQRMIAGDALLEFNSGLIIEAWDRLRGVVELTRRAQHPQAWVYSQHSTTTLEADGLNPGVAS